MTTRFPPVTCWCGKTFTPHQGNQKHCCPRHKRIYVLATRCKWKDLIETDPAAVLEHYKFVK